MKPVMAPRTRNIFWIMVCGAIIALGVYIFWGHIDLGPAPPEAHDLFGF